jgi:hypothetical protein
MANFAPVPTISVIPQGPLTGAGSDLRLRPGQGTIGTAAQQSYPRAPWNPAGGSLAGGVFGSGGPRIVDAGGGDGSVDPQTTGAIGGGNNLPTLDALLARQKELAGEQSPMGEMISPWQGVAYAADKFMSGLERGRVDRQEVEQRQHLAEIMSGPIGPEQIAQAFAISPEIGVHLLDLQAKKSTEKPQDNWVDMPTPQGENGRWQRNTANGETRRVGSGDLDGGGTPKLTDQSSLRQDYISDPAYKNWSQAKPIWDALKDAAPRLTGPSALNVIIGMAKLFDPGSVVRGEEGETIRRTGGPSDILAGWAEYIKGHGGLSESQRDELMREGYGRMQGYYNALQHHRQWISGIAQRNGFRPEDVVDDPGELAPYKSENDPPPAERDN